MLVRKITVADIISNIISIIFGLILTGLFVRLLLRLLGASSEAPFVQFIYNSTAPLLTPFNGIFNSVVIEANNILESPTLVAIVFYLLLAYIIDSFIDFLDYNTRRYKVVN